MSLLNLVPFKKNRTEIAKNHDESDENPLVEFHRQMDSLMENFFSDFFGEDAWNQNSLAGPLVPSIDMQDNKKNITVRAELPGVKEDDLDIQLSGRLLTIKGVKSEEREDEAGEYYHRESRYGSFTRQLQLPTDVKSDEVKANFKDGVLKVELPKTKEGAHHQRIQIAS